MDHAESILENVLVAPCLITRLPPKQTRRGVVTVNNVKIIRRKRAITQTIGMPDFHPTHHEKITIYITLVTVRITCYLKTRSARYTEETNI